MALKCGWLFCDQRFEIVEDLEYHACFHGIEIAKETDHKFQFTCQWSGCNRLIYENIGDPVKLPRHILRHCLEEHLIMVATQLVGETECEEAPVVLDLPEEEFLCLWNNCSFKSESAWSYYVHTRSHLLSTNDKPIICQWSNCNQVVEPDNSSVEHMKEHTEEPYAMCKACRRIFPNAEKLEAHYLGSNNYKCRWIDCGTEFSCIEELESHVSEHVRDLDPYQPCGWKNCTWQFSGLIRSDNDKLLMQKQLQAHVYRHTYSAERCQYARNLLKKSRYSSLGSCKWYANRESNCFDKELQDVDTFVCKWQYCLKEFNNPRLYFLHVAQHVPSGKDHDPPFYCKWKDDVWSNKCDLQCATRGNLQRHLQVHTNEYKLQCEVCFFVFKASNIFAEHLMSQTKSSDITNNKHVCPECKRNFASKHYLRSHLNSHKNEFPCPTCEQVFPTEYAMRKHSRLTHQRSAYRCSFCPVKFNGKCKEYASKDSLNRHIKTAHIKEFNGEPSSESDLIYVCSEPRCGFSTRQPHQYRSHWLNCHRVEASHYICHICYATFDKSIKLTNHLKSVHLLKPKPPYDKFSYEMCDDGFFKLASEASIMKNK